MVKDKGFTLIEMIVAITLLGICMVLAYAALHVANRSIVATEKLHTDMEALRATYSVLYQQLSQASNKGLKVPGFRGRSRTLRFISTVPTRAIGGGRKYRFHLYQETSDNQLTRLILSYEPVETINEDEQAVKQVLAEFKGHVEFLYHSGQMTSSGDPWVDSWSRNDVPHLVKLTLVGEPEFKWPEQVVELHYAGS